MDFNTTTRDSVAIVVGMVLGACQASEKVELRRVPGGVRGTRWMPDVLCSASMNSAEGSPQDKGERQVTTSTVRQEDRQREGVDRNDVVDSPNVDVCDTTRRVCETIRNDDESPAKCLGRN